MIPPTRATQRRASSSTNRPRKRHRFNSPLRGGAPIKLLEDWPYTPLQTKESVISFFNEWYRHIAKLAKTKLDNDRNGLLDADEVASMNDLIDFHLDFYWHVVEGELKQREPLAVILDCLDFLGSFYVVNTTPNTIVHLVHVPDLHVVLRHSNPQLIETNFLTKCPTIYVDDWREGSGGTEQKPTRTEIPLRQDKFELSQRGDKLLIELIDEIPDNKVTLEVDWLGPHDHFKSLKRGDLPKWTELMKIEKQPQLEAEESLSEQSDAFYYWLPFLRFLAETKKVGRNLAIEPNALKKMLEEINAKYEAWETCAEAEEPIKDFKEFMNCVRVLNVTNETTVLVQTKHQVVALPHNEPVYLTVDHPTQIIRTEIQYPKMGTRKRVLSDKLQIYPVQDYVVVKLFTNRLRAAVTLVVHWLGPKQFVPDKPDTTWATFMRMDDFYQSIRFQGEMVRAEEAQEEENRQQRHRYARVPRERIDYYSLDEPLYKVYLAAKRVSTFVEDAARRRPTLAWQAREEGRRLNPSLRRRLDFDNIPQGGPETAIDLTDVLGFDNVSQGEPETESELNDVLDLDVLRGEPETESDLTEISDSTDLTNVTDLTDVSDLEYSIE